MSSTAPSSALSFSQLETLWSTAAQNLGYSSLEAIAPIMAEVALLESGGDPLASVVEPNGQGGQQTSNGLWQISTGTLSQPANWSDPLTNAELAVQKFVSQGPTVAWPNTFPQALTNFGAPQAGAAAAAQVAQEQTPSVPAWAQNAVVVVVVLVLGFLLLGAWRKS